MPATLLIQQLARINRALGYSIARGQHFVLAACTTVVGVCGDGLCEHLSRRLVNLGQWIPIARDINGAPVARLVAL